ncbi:opsin, ultraviolet-sensitive [Culicoides brevitarsis]|uniref:opsin, ultraviolet-sensitive n=1 Tax=Culicoides brevitarsis TaxID=469753 RepID=UPI00307C9965
MTYKIIIAKRSIDTTEQVPRLANHIQENVENRISSTTTTPTTTSKDVVASTITTINNSSTSRFSIVVAGTTTNEINITELFRNYSSKSGFKGKLDPRYLNNSINPFWLQFEPPSHTQHLTFAIIYMGMMVVGWFGNLLVIFMYIRFRSLRTPANQLVINLAVSDFFMLCLGPAFVYNSLHEGPFVSEFVCRLYGLVGGLTGTASIATLTCISIDRYNVVVYPLNPLRSTTKLRSRIMIIGIWIYSLLFACVPFLDIGLSKYVPEGFLTACSFEYLSPSKEAKIFMFTYFVFAWVVPLTIIIYCYFYILRVVVSPKSIRSSKDKNKTEIKLALVVIGVIGLWFLAWTPYSIVALLGISGNERYLTPLGSMIPAVFCKISACINPYLYAVNHPRFRSELRRLLGCPVESRFNSDMRTSFISKQSTVRRTGGRNGVIDSAQVATQTHASTTNNNECPKMMPEMGRRAPPIRRATTSIDTEMSDDTAGESLMMDSSV